MAGIEGDIADAHLIDAAEPPVPVVLAGVVVRAVTPTSDGPPPRLAIHVVSRIDQSRVGAGADVEGSRQNILGVRWTLAVELEGQAIAGRRIVVPFVGGEGGGVLHGSLHSGCVHVGDAEAVAVLHLEIERSGPRVGGCHTIALAADHGAVGAKGRGVKRGFDRPGQRGPGVDVGAGGRRLVGPGKKRGVIAGVFREESIGGSGLRHCGPWHSGLVGVTSPSVFPGPDGIAVSR